MMKRYRNSHLTIAVAVAVVFLYVLVAPQSAMSAQGCVSQRGTIDAQNEFTADPSGSDFKLDCSGIEGTADFTSIRALLDSTAGYVAGTSKVLIDFGTVSRVGSLDINSDADLNIVRGTITSSGVDRSVIGFGASDPGGGETPDLRVHSHATITATGNGRRGITAYNELGGNTEVTNYGTITTEGGPYTRPPERMYRFRRGDGIHAGVENGAGNVKINNAVSGIIVAKGAGARGINAYVYGPGNVDVENSGSITTEGDTWDKRAEGGYKYRAYGASASALSGNATAINRQGGTITTRGTEAHGLAAFTEGPNAGTATAINEGTITTTGNFARGVTTWSESGNASSHNRGTITSSGTDTIGVAVYGDPSEVAGRSLSATNSGTIRGNGADSEGVEVFFLLDGPTDTDALGSATATNSGEVVVTDEGVSAGFYAIPGPGKGRILNSGNATVENTGTVVVSGTGTLSPGGFDAVGLLAWTYGTGTSKITMTNGSVSVGSEADGNFGTALYGYAETDSTSDDSDTDEDVIILVSGSSTTVRAYGGASDDANGPFDERKGIAILAETVGTTGHSKVTISDGASVSAFGTGGESGYAVMFRGGRGTLEVMDSSLVGNIAFADGEYDDNFTIRNTISKAITGNVNFFGGDDTLNIDVAENRSLIFDGDIMGLETLNKSGLGYLRLNGDVGFEGSTLNLDDGVLIIAGTLDLKTGELMIKEAANLVFEVKDGTDFGKLIAGTLHFDGTGTKSVSVQLNADLTTAQVNQVRQLLSQQSLQFLEVATVSSGDQNAPAGITNLMITSESADGTVMTVGEIDTRTGLSTFSDENLNLIARLNIPQPVADSSAPTAPSGSGTGTATSGGGGGGGALGLGLLAVLLAAYSGGDDDEVASFDNYYFSTPQSAYIASANERGILKIQESGSEPVQMWVRTSQGAQTLQMTGAANSAVNGTEVGLTLYGRDDFNVSASVTPNLAAEVSSLNLAARGGIYSLSAGWRTDKYFAGLRLSQGEFDVDSIVDNPIVNSALVSNAKLQTTQAQFSAGATLQSGKLRFTPSAAIQVGTFKQSEHVAESPVLKASVPGFSQNYTSASLGLGMTSNEWLSFASGTKWKPLLQFDTILTNSRQTEQLTLNQSDRIGALNFNTRAGIRAMPDVVNSLSFGAKFKSSSNRNAEWKFGFAGLEADGEEYYAAMGVYRLRF